MLRILLRPLTMAMLAASALTISACGDDTTTNPGATPTFSTLQSEIFTKKCAISGCHVGTTAPHGLDLSAGKAYANLVGVASQEVPELKRVNASNADSSYVVIKVEGSSRMAPGTLRMPLTGTALTSDQITMIRQWITAGAKND